MEAAGSREIRYLSDSNLDGAVGDDIPRALMLDAVPSG
jgi:hypothetical protein